MDIFDRRFNKRKNIPMYWYNKSCDLRASAGVIWYGIYGGQEDVIVKNLNLGEGFDLSIATYPTFPLLCGLSLELMYKAIFVAMKLKVPTTHNLLTLAKKAGIKLTKQEEGFLAILTEAVVWNGKYPVPTDNHKDSVEILDKLVTEHLFDEIEISGDYKGLQANRSFNWDSFNNLWSEGGKLFFANRLPDNEYLKE